MEFGEVKKQEEQRSVTAIASDKTLGSVSMGFSYKIVRMFFQCKMPLELPKITLNGLTLNQLILTQ